MDLKGWVITTVDGMRLVGVEAEAEALSPVYEMRIDVVPVPRPVEIEPGKRALIPMPTMLRQLMPVHGCPSITSYPIPGDARLIDLATLSVDDQKEIAKLIEDAREGIKQREMQQRSGLVVPP